MNIGRKLLFSKCPGCLAAKHTKTQGLWDIFQVTSDAAIASVTQIKLNRVT